MKFVNQPAMLEALLSAQEQRHSVRLYLHRHRLPLDGTLLGFDFYRGHLLIETLPTTGLPPLGTSCWLQLRAADAYLRVQCQLIEMEGDLLTFNMVDYQLSDQQRWQPRIYFRPRRGPACVLQVPNRPPLEGTIRDLSPLGVRVDLLGRDSAPELRGIRQLNCSLHFNELFCLRQTAELKQAQFKRLPSCHTTARLIFHHQNIQTYEQLEHFIDALAMVEPVAARTSPLFRRKAA